MPIIVAKIPTPNIPALITQMISLSEALKETERKALAILELDRRFLSYNSVPYHFEERNIGNSPETNKYKEDKCNCFPGCLQHSKQTNLAVPVAQLNVNENPNSPLCL